MKASQGGLKVKAKKTMQFYEPSVEQFDDTLYLISSEVWVLGGGGPRKLSQTEIADLPIIISWRGPDYQFRSDEEECIRLICLILGDMNIMQNKKFISFPLGRCKQHVGLNYLH